MCITFLDGGETVIEELCTGQIGEEIAQHAGIDETLQRWNRIAVERSDGMFDLEGDLLGLEELRRHLGWRKRWYRRRRHRGDHRGHPTRCHGARRERRFLRRLQRRCQCGQIRGRVGDGGACRRSTRRPLGRCPRRGDTRTVGGRLDAGYNARDEARDVRWCTRGAHGGHGRGRGDARSSRGRESRRDARRWNRGEHGRLIRRSPGLHGRDIHQSQRNVSKYREVQDTEARRRIPAGRGWKALGATQPSHGTAGIVPIHDIFRPKGG